MDAAREECGVVKRWWSRYAGSVAFVALIALAVVGFFRLESVASDAEEAASSAKATVERQDREQAERRDQACVLFERTYREDKRSYREERRNLRLTIEYLATVPPAEANSALNAAIRAGLRRQRVALVRQREEVKAKRPPPYCAKPGVGLHDDEPEPRRPKGRPPNSSGAVAVPTAVIVLPPPR